MQMLLCWRGVLQLMSTVPQSCLRDIGLRYDAQLIAGKRGERFVFKPWARESHGFSDALHVALRVRLAYTPRGQAGIGSRRHTHHTFGLTRIVPRAAADHEREIAWDDRPHKVLVRTDALEWRKLR